MSVHKRGTKWHYAFCIRKVRYRGALPEARTKFQAEQAETKIKLSVFEARYGKQTGDKDLVEFIDEVYLPWARQNKRTWKHDEFRARTIADSFNGKKFSQISPLLIEKFKKERHESITKKGTRRSAASVNRELELLSRIFNLAIDCEVAESNPCSKVRKLRLNNKRIRYLLDEEAPRLLAALTGPRAHLRPLVIVALGTGMRRGDQLNLRWGKSRFPTECNLRAELENWQGLYGADESRRSRRIACTSQSRCRE